MKGWILGQAKDTIPELRQEQRDIQAYAANKKKIKLQAMHYAPPHRDLFPMHFCSIRAENNLK